MSNKLMNWFHQAGQRFQNIYNSTDDKKLQDLIDKAEKTHYKIYLRIEKLKELRSKEK